MNDRTPFRALGSRRLGGVDRSLPQTPIQRACRHLADALEAAREDERANEVFADMLMIVAAREGARRAERDDWQLAA